MGCSVSLRLGSSRCYSVVSRAGLWRHCRPERVCGNFRANIDGWTGLYRKWVDSAGLSFYWMGCEQLMGFMQEFFAKVRSTYIWASQIMYNLALLLCWGQFNPYLILLLKYMVKLFIYWNLVNISCLGSWMCMQSFETDVFWKLLCWAHTDSSIDPLRIGLYAICQKWTLKNTKQSGNKT